MTDIAAASACDLQVIRAADGGEFSRTVPDLMGNEMHHIAARWMRPSTAIIVPQNLATVFLESPGSDDEVRDAGFILERD